jgi:hypothetical protein
VSALVNRLGFFSLKLEPLDIDARFLPRPCQSTTSSGSSDDGAGLGDPLPHTTG